MLIDSSKPSPPDSDQPNYPAHDEEAEFWNVVILIVIGVASVMLLFGLVMSATEAWGG